MSIKKTLLYIMAFCASLVLLFSGSFPVMAQESRVFDNAGLFTQQEKAELERQLSDAMEAMNMDLAVLTVTDAKGYSAEAYADNFYEQQNLGVGNDHSGAVCVIDMDNRELRISTEGMMSRILTDDRLNTILDRAAEDIGNEKYLSGVEIMIDEIVGYQASGVVQGQYHYDRDTGAVDVYRKRSIAWYEALFALAAAGAAAGLTCSSVVKQYKMESERRQSLNYHMAYRGASAFAFALSNDLFINKVVSQRRIQTTPRGGSGAGGGSSAGRSTMHRSSSGRSHGGGGRKF